MRKLYLDSGVNITPENSLLAGDFINFCADSLPIVGDFEIYVVSDRNSHHIDTTAAYHIGKNIVKVYGRDRALVDILRSIAHELTHMMQDECGILSGEIQDAGGSIEDEANARAGELIKLYAKSHPKRKRIYESYIKQNVLK
jgi:Zn-dependent peptidase ImmA (M78 family)